MANNIIITGIPRSGTTLTCHLLNKLPNVVALHEPISSTGWTSVEGQGIDDLIYTFFEQSRESLQVKKTAISKQLDGQVPDNPKQSDALWLRVLQRLRVGRIELEKLRLGTCGLRQSRVSHGRIVFEKPLKKDFTLCIKHNGQFTGLLPSLLQRYFVYAIIRNPLAVLCSWNSIRFGPREGHMYVVEKMNPELAKRLAEQDDRYQRQLVLLSWFYEQYEQYLNSQQIIRYEELIESNGQALSVIVKEAGLLNEALEDKNPVYNDRKLNALLAEKLLASKGAYWKFYSRQSVEELTTQLCE